MMISLRYNSCCRTLKTRFARNCAIFCSISVLVILSGCATPVRIDGEIKQFDEEIKRYQNNVFTNGGQGSLEEFEKQLTADHDKIVNVENLRVWVGYHGDRQGNWFSNFNSTTIIEVERIVERYPNATLIWAQPGKGLSDQTIKDEVMKGNVFFTWGNSDTRVRKVMEKEGLPLKL